MTAQKPHDTGTHRTTANKLTRYTADDCKDPGLPAQQPQQPEHIISHDDFEKIYEIEYHLTCEERRGICERSRPHTPVQDRLCDDCNIIELEEKLLQAERDIINAYSHPPAPETKQLDPNYDYVQDDDHPWALLGTPKPDHADRKRAEAAYHQGVKAGKKEAARAATLAALEDLLEYRKSNVAVYGGALAYVNEGAYIKERIQSLRKCTTTAPATCIWSEDDDGIWNTGCDHKFELISGEAPLRQGIKFCSYCGKEIRQSTTAEKRG